ncbi:MAG TPA: butyrate kinase [Firmicutes bacterium]|nr:butyrate kinase [Bacillota bacterium]
MENAPKILAINPGSTSTKIALFEGETLLYEENIAHSVEELSRFENIYDQLQYRESLVLESLKAHGTELSELSAVAGRGGLLPPMEGGVWAVNDDMLDDLRHRPRRHHPSNLGALIAWDIATQAGVKLVVIVDPVSTDEFEEIARITGLPEIKRDSLSHALNLKAVARLAAREMGKKYEELNLVVCHLGGGITVSAHRKGRMIDCNDPSSSGPFSPERAGDLPNMALAELCYSGKYTEKEMKARLMGKGGLVAHLGTNSCKEVEERISAGDTRAELVYQAMAYQVAKWIGQMAVALNGKVDAICLSGGIAHSGMFIGWIKPRVSWIAPIKVYPGSDEMRALAMGALRALRGEEKVKEYRSIARRMPLPQFTEKVVS